jgi:hypothetical protein
VFEGRSAFDGLTARLDALAKPVATGRAGPALQGNSLGHPVHPALSDLPIGFWTSANLLNLIGGSGSQVAARRLIALGLLSVPATAAAGLADYSTITRSEDRRVATVHAVGNLAATVLYLASSWGRARHGRGKLLAPGRCDRSHRGRVPRVAPRLRRRSGATRRARFTWSTGGEVDPPCRRETDDNQTGPALNSRRRCNARTSTPREQMARGA